MLDIVVRKVEQLRQSVLFHGKYIEKFDALSLSSLDVDDQGRVIGNIGELPGLTKLLKELNNILNEGHVARQEFTSNIQKDLKRCIKIQLTLLKQTSNQSVKADVFSEENGTTQSQDQPLEISLLEQELKNQLKLVYESITDAIEERLRIIRMIKEIMNTYESAIIEMGSESGVLNPSKKAKWVMIERVSPIFQHNVFVVEEEEEMLNKVKEIWAGMYLGNSDHHLIAEKHLSLVVHSKKVEEDMDWKFFVQFGCILILLCWSISECIHNESIGTKVWRDPTFAIFMCFGDLLLLLLMWSISMHVWKNAGIDYLRLLNLQEITTFAKLKYPVSKVLRLLVQEIIIFLVTFLCFNKVLRYANDTNHNVYTLAIAHALPVAMAIYFCYRLLSPWSERKQWIYMLWRVIAAPWYEIEFRDSYIGDLLTSLVRVSVPLVFSLVYIVLSLLAYLQNDMNWVINTSDRWWTEDLVYTVGILPFFTIYPLYIRLLQCCRRAIETGNRWPHFMNGLKYASAIVVIAYGTFQPTLRSNPTWIACFISATIFQFLWDVFQDWGIVQIVFPSSSDGNSWLERLPSMTFRIRQKRLLGPIWIYMIVICFNLALRFAWTVTLLPEIDNDNKQLSLYLILTNHAGPVIAAGEIIRRMVWGFFRLEYEQIELIKKTNFENISDMMNDDKSYFDKMDISSGNENHHVDREVSSMSFQMLGSSSSEPSSLSSSSSPSDWTAYLPRFLLDGIQSYYVAINWNSKVRFMESILFCGIVCFLIFSAALPAVASAV